MRQNTFYFTNNQRQYVVKHTAKSVGIQSNFYLCINTLRTIEIISNILTKILQNMKTISETGHAKNVANFETLITIVTSFGTTYNPAKSSIQLGALQTLLASAKASVSAVNQAESIYKNAIDERSIVFNGFAKKVSNIYNILKSSDSSSLSDETVKTIYRKLQGRRAGSKLTEEEIAALKAQGKEVTQNSVSQMSYDNRLANFDRFISMISTITAYNPNEADYKIDGLRSYYDELFAKNITVTTAFVALENVRIVRNQVLYGALTGLVDLASDVKSYLKGIFGANSPQYRQVSGISFKAG